MTSFTTTLPQEITELLNLLNEMESEEEFEHFSNTNPYVDRSLSSIFLSDEHYQFIATVLGEAWLFCLDLEYNSWAVQSLGAPVINYNHDIPFPDNSETATFHNCKALLITFKSLLGDSVVVIETADNSPSVFEYMFKNKIEEIWRDAWDQFILSKFPGFGSYLIKDRPPATVSMTLFFS